MTSYFTRVSITGPESAPSDFPSILSFVPRPSGQNVYWPVRFPGPDSPSKRRDVEPWITILREDLPRMHTTSDIPSPSELKAFTRLAFESADFATFRRIRIDYFDFRPLLRFFSLRMLTAQTLEKKETRLTARAETLVPFSRLDRRFVWNNEASKYRNDAVILLEERNSICSRRASTTSFYFCRANHQEARNVDERRDERVTFHSLDRRPILPSFDVLIAPEDSYDSNSRWCAVLCRTVVVSSRYRSLRNFFSSFGIPCLRNSVVFFKVQSLFFPSYRPG